MANKMAALVIGFLAVSAGSAYGQQCLHGPEETPEQSARRRDALIATRIVNTIQASQPGAANRTFLRQVDLEGAASAAKMRESPNDTVKRISLNPNEEILSGWKLTLDVTENGYWFMIRDTTDPCGFAFVSNQEGLIFTAEPIR